MSGLDVFARFYSPDFIYRRGRYLKHRLSKPPVGLEMKSVQDKNWRETGE